MQVHSFLSSDSVAGVGTDVFGVEGKNNVRFRHTCLFKFVRDAVFGAITLYPDFPVDNVQVDQAVMDAPDTPLPTHGQNEITIVNSIKDGLMVNG